MGHHITLPAEPIDMMAGRFEAESIVKDLYAAYWLRGREDETALFLFQKAHQEFAAMADAMGYTITPKAAEATK
jgi:hypothetical protein